MAYLFACRTTRWALLFLCGLVPASTRADDTVLKARVNSVEFLSDHKALHKNSKDLRNGGERYPDVVWTRDPRVNHPITHTGGEHTRVRINLTIVGVDADTPYFLQGISDEPGLCFRAEGRLSPADDLAIDVQSTRPLTREVRKLRARILWLLTIRPGTEESDTALLGSTGPHPIFVTYGTPRHTDEARGVVTDARMEYVMARIAAATKETSKTASGPRIVYQLMAQHGQYYLPTRHFDRAEIWKVPESWRMTPAGANCISIVEFVAVLCHMVGIEGTIEINAYYALPRDPRTARKGGLGEPPLKKKGADGKEWQLFLVDEGNTSHGQVGGVGGMNFYEATLEYEWKGKRYYYPGGTYRVYDDPNHILTVFRTLAWATYDWDIKDWVVQEVVTTYMQPGDTRPPDVKLPR